MNESTEDDPWARSFHSMQHSAKGPRKLDPSITRSICDENPLEAGRKGECDIALEVLLEFYPNAQPFRLTSKERDAFDHVFLMLDGQALDIVGFMPVETLIKKFPDDDGNEIVAIPTTLEEIKDRYKSHRTESEAQQFKILFRQFIESNRKILFQEAP